MHQRRLHDRPRSADRQVEPLDPGSRPATGPLGRCRPTVRPSNALALQSLAGNGAVAGAIGAASGPPTVQRWSLADLTDGLAEAAGTAWRAATTIYERAAAEVERKSRSATGEQADEYLRATPLIRRFVKAQVEDRALTVAGAIRFDDDTAFTAEYVAFSVELARKRADFDEMRTVDEAIAHVAGVNGFVRGDVVHIHKDRARAGTVVHESLHLYSAGFRRSMGKPVDEGVTEYFTRMVCRTNGILRVGVYDEHLAAVTRLVDRLPGGEDVLADAYFGGDMHRLRPAFDPDGGLPGTDQAAEGKRRFRMWRQHMRAKDFAAAGQLFD